MSTSLASFGEPRGDHGPSIKNPATYEALKREGHSKTSAARISNGVLRKGYKRGVHRSKPIAEGEEEVVVGATVADFLDEHHASPHGPPHGGRGWAKKVGRVAANTGLSRRKARGILKARKAGKKSAGKFAARVMRNMKKTGVDRATARKQVVEYKQAHRGYLKEALDMRESVKSTDLSFEQVQDKLRAALRERHPVVPGQVGQPDAWPRAVWNDRLVYSLGYDGDKLYEATYVIDGGRAILGEARPVVERRSFVPLSQFTEHNVTPHGPAHGGRGHLVAGKPTTPLAAVAGKSNAERYAAGTKNTAEHRALGAAAMVDRSRITYGRHIAKHAPDVAGPAGKLERGEPLSAGEKQQLHAAVDRLKAANKYNGSGEKAARAAIDSAAGKMDKRGQWDAPVGKMPIVQTGSPASARAAAAAAGFVGIVRRNDPKLAKLYGGKDKIPPVSRPVPKKTPLVLGREPDRTGPAYQAKPTALNPAWKRRKKP